MKKTVFQVQEVFANTRESERKQALNRLLNHLRTPVVHHRDKPYPPEREQPVYIPLDQLEIARKSGLGFAEQDFKPPRLRRMEHVPPKEDVRCSSRAPRSTAV